MIEPMQLPHHPASDMDKETLTDAIHFLKSQKNAVILAHYYQYPEIQDLADFVGDSLALARQAAQTDADRIVFCGVHFMAETAKILNPEKKVLLPDLNAGCSLADSCPPESFSQFLQENPGHTVVSYVNCTAEVKAMSDIICTSSNAEDIINSIPESQPIIFAPDANLGRYLQQVTGRTMKLWEGACLVHEAFAFDKLITLMRKEPCAELIAHPEAESDILRMADFIGSTGKLLKYVKESQHDKFIIATEVGIIHQMQQDVPNKKLIPAPIYEDNTCACSECAFMKMNTLEKLHRCLVHDSPEIKMDSTLLKEAKKPLERMLEYSK